MKNIVTRLCLMLAFIMTATVSYAAEKEIIPIGLGKHTTKEGIYQNNYYSFTAPITGTLTISSAGDVPSVFKDETFETPIEFDWLGFGIGLGKAYSGHVEKDVTYYLHVNPYSPITFELTIEASDAKPKIDNITPAEGSVFSATGDGLIGIRFSKSINYSSAKITANGVEAEIDGVNQNGIYAFDIKKTLFKWLTDKTVKAGDEMFFIMEGVCDANNPATVYGEDGTVKVKYIAPGMPIVKEKESVPSKFLSYWIPGDEDGMIKLTFSGEVAEGAIATLSWGNKEAEGEFYSEDIEAKTEGNTITIDLTGKLRTAKTMLPNSTSTASYTDINIQINHIKDKQGNYCYADGQGSLGSFGYLFEYKDISGNIVSEITLLDNKPLAETNTVEIWINDASLLHSYSGVKFAYTTTDNKQNTVIVAKDKLTESKDGNELIINVPLPEEVKAAQSVKVSLADALFADGLEHAVEAVFTATPSGINGIINSDNSTFEIHAIDGKQVKRNASKAALGTLKAGIYVIDGRKVIIK